MLEFLRPIVFLSTWLYIGLGLLGLFFLRLIWLARKDRTRSIFTLERENANVRITRYIVGLLIVFIAMFGVYYLNLVTPQIVPPAPNTPIPTPIQQLPPTPTPPQLFPPTPTATLTPLVPTPTLVEAIVPEVNDTAVPQEQPTTQPLTSGQPTSCLTTGISISQPSNGAQVDGVVQIVGTATIDNFDYYKFEFQDPISGNWGFISRYDTPVEQGVLGQWNSDTVSPGGYSLRLVVVDQTGNFPEPCVIRLRVQ